MISKELLSKVLGNKVESIRLIEEYDGRIGGRANDLHITFEDYVENINIYEIAHKCKKWAYGLEVVDVGVYMIDSNYANKGNCWLRDGSGNPPEYFCAKTEPEAIFKACEWIFKEIK